MSLVGKEISIHQNYHTIGELSFVSGLIIIIFLRIITDMHALYAGCLRKNSIFIFPEILHIISGP